MLERQFALVAVAFAVHHDALVFLSADVRHGARKHLQGVQQLAAVAYQSVGVGGDHVDPRMLSVFVQFGGGGNVHQFKQPVQKLRRALAVGGLFAHADARLHGFCEQAALFALFQHGDLRLFAPDAQRPQPFFNGLFYRFAAEFVLFHLVFPPFRSLPVLRADCGILWLYFACISSSSFFLKRASITRLMRSVLAMLYRLLTIM